MNYVENEREEYEATYDRPPQRKDVYGDVPPTRSYAVYNGSSTNRLSPYMALAKVKDDRIVALEAQVLALKIERDTAMSTVKILLKSQRELQADVARLSPKAEQKPSTGDLLARAASFDRPLDAYAR